MKTICVFGASTVWGAGDAEKGGWVERLRLLPFAAEPDPELRVYNLGIPGNTTKDVLERFEAEAAARKPDFVIFAIGGNDTIVRKQGGHLIELEKFEKNMEGLVGKARVFTNDILLVGMQRVDETKTTPIPWAPEYSYYNRDTEAYEKKLQEVAEREGVFYLSMHDLLSAEDLADGLHPNATGHQKIFERVKSFLQESKFI